MKKLFFLPAIAFILTTTVNAQATPASLKTDIKIDKMVDATIKKDKRKDRKELRKLEGYEVSYQAKEAFGNDFPDATSIQWKRLDNFDKATFSKDGQISSAFYDWDSKLVGTTQNKTFTDIPTNAQKIIKKKYSGYTVKDVVFYDDNELNETDMILYDEFASEDSYFVELQKGSKRIVVQALLNGEVGYFTSLK